MTSLWLCGAVVLCAVLGGVWACDRHLCASLVSRCQLIQACDCDMEVKKNCPCCKNCSMCLDNLFLECCSCVGLCPLPNPEENLYSSSTIDVLSDPIPDLFDVLNEERDYLQRWTTFRYPIHFDAMYAKETNMEPGLDQSIDPDLHKDSQKNCTVAFMSECTSERRCKQSCRSMGAAKLRWFHNSGCCQCIGEPCQGFGLDEAKCLKCQSEEEQEDNHTPGEAGKEEAAVKQGEDLEKLPAEGEELTRHPHHHGHNQKHNHHNSHAQDQFTENT